MATVTEKDIKVMARIITLIESGPKGVVPIAIVTDGALAQKDYDSFVQILGSGKELGNITLKPIAIRPDDVGTTDAKVIFIPEGLEITKMNTIFNAAQAKKLITISTSEDCLNSRKCAIYIKSDPAVDIKMSVAAADATNVKFSSTLRMMIKEVP
jgi:hypothetical protein